MKRSLLAASATLWLGLPALLQASALFVPAEGRCIKVANIWGHDVSCDCTKDGTGSLQYIEQVGLCTLNDFKFGKISRSGGQLVRSNNDEAPQIPTPYIFVKSDTERYFLILNDSQKSFLKEAIHSTLPWSVSGKTFVWPNIQGVAESYLIADELAIEE